MSPAAKATRARATDGTAKATPEPPARPRPTGRAATDRVLRMLSIVPWIAAQDGPRIAEVCERFGLKRAQLLDDLEVIQFVGLPPYTPDMLIEVVVDGDRVWVRFAEVFSRPLRLTPNQALGLVAAGAALSATASGSAPGEGEGEGGDAAATGPLATGLAKLARMLGIAPEEAITIRLGSSRPEVLETLRDGLRRQQQVHIDYYVYSRDQRTERDVDPYRVFAADGAWYLYGYCHLARSERLFRVDRISRAERRDATFERPASANVDPALLHVTPETPRVTLDLAPAARWVAETYPVEESSERPDGRLRVRLAVASRPWFERLALRLGSDAEVVATTDPALPGTGREAARRVLARYRRGATPVATRRQ
jgi:predicted DNA-binding transcriptional regulator YafY